jgi:hypothetical protein
MARSRTVPFFVVDGFGRQCEAALEACAETYVFGNADSEIILPKGFDAPQAVAK